MHSGIGSCSPSGSQGPVPHQGPSHPKIHPELYFICPLLWSIHKLWVTVGALTATLVKMRGYYVAPYLRGLRAVGSSGQTHSHTQSLLDGQPQTSSMVDSPHCWALLPTHTK